MKLPKYSRVLIGLGGALLLLGLIGALLYSSSPTVAVAQNSSKISDKKEAPLIAAETKTAASTNATARTVNPSAAAPQGNIAVAPGAVSPPTSAVPTGAIATAPPGSSAPNTVAPNAPSATNAQAKAESELLSPTAEIPVSFQGANVDMVVQWLAKTTGKSVVKHPRVQCQLTIVSSKNLPVRDAVNLIYRALSLEGFSAIESSKSILIVPEGQEPKMNPELLDASKTEIPEGRQKLIKVFPLKHIPPGELRDKVRPVLSDKATVEVDDRASQLIVTDYNDNLRLLSELIKELDVASASDSTIEIFTLRFSQAEDLASLLSLILNAQAGTPASSSPPPPSPAPPSITISGPGPGGPMMRPPQPSGGGSSGPSGGGSSSSASSASGQQVKLWPDKTANRLIVAASKSKMPEVKKMIDILDVDKPADVGVRVLQLKNVSAEDLVKEIGPLYQKMSGKSLRDTIEVTASSRSNALIVLSSEANFKALEKLISALDTEGAQEKVMQAFALKNADAEDVAKQLQELSQDQQPSRYSYFIYPISSGKDSKKINVVADRRRNTVIVQAPPGRMEGVAKMIQTLDEPVTDNNLAPKIYALKFVSATDLEDVLNELFLKKTQQRSYWWDDYPQETADKNVGRLYGKVRIISEPYSNSLIVTANSPEHLAAVEEVIKQLDAPSQSGESTLRIGLRFAKAPIVANSINILFAKNGSPPLRPVNPQGQPNPNPQPQQPQQNASSTSNFELDQESKEEGYFPWLGGQPDNPRANDGRTVRPVSDLVGRVRVVADQRSNSLLISANVHFFPQILKLIEDMDAPTSEVLIEARILEVSSDFLDKLGVRWSPDGSKVFTAADYDNSILAHAGGQYNKGFGGKTTIDTPGLAGGLPQALASLRSGLLDSSISMDYLVQFLRQNTDATVLAQPQINIKDNETGRLFVGQQVPFINNSVVQAQGGQNSSFSYKPVGVVLEVTPHINSSGDVALKIHAESSAIVPGQTILGGALIDTRAFKTDLEAKSGETLVLGGIIQKQVSDTLRKTPILGSIPGLGWAFKKKDKTAHEVELMVFLRPKVVRTPQDAKELMEETDKKAPLIKKWKEDSSMPTDQKSTKEKK